MKFWLGGWIGSGGAGAGWGCAASTVTVKSTVSYVTLQHQKLCSA